jgi:4-amino-4-deoxy-L-arabinose transferase-like glycosyltransferase
MSLDQSTAETARAPALSPAVRGFYVRHGPLLAILLVAGVLRIAWLTAAPPGLNQDEAANAWNAWCLLKTGHDQVGAGWPVFYFRALGENRSPLFLYTLLPFQLLGGMNVWTSRLPSAVSGLASILLLYWIAKRLFDRPTALVAAALLALTPWHMQLSRFGHEAALGPLLACVALASLLWAGLPLSDQMPRPSVWKGLVAGLVIGVCCYGYPAVLLFIPIFLVVCVLVTCRAWWRRLHQRAALLAAAGLAIGVGVTFGPLLYYHMAHPEVIEKRGAFQALWPEDAPLSAKAAAVAERYVAHFDPAYLFAHADHSEIHTAAGYGLFQWYTLPLMLAGLAVILRNLRRSTAARILFCWLVLYPAGDCFYRGLDYQAADGSWHNSLHMLRGAPGLVAPALLAAVGAAAVGVWLWRRSRVVGTGALVLATLAAVGFEAPFWTYYFGAHTRRPFVYANFHVALVEACSWMKPGLDQVDAVVISSASMSSPYVVAMVALDYDPQRWFQDERTIRTMPDWDRYVRVGKLFFYYDKGDLAPLEALKAEGRLHRVVYIVHPGETQLSNPVHTIYGPDGRPALLIYAGQF